MATLTRRFASSRSKQVRRNSAGSQQGCGDDVHALAGSTGSGSTEYLYRSLMAFAVNATTSWDGMARVVKIELAIKTETSSTHYTVGTAPRTRIQRLTGSFTDGSNHENVWTPGEYQWPGSTGGVEFDSPVNPATGKAQDETWVFADVTALLAPNVKKGLPIVGGLAGGGIAPLGILLRAPGTEKSDTQRMIFHSFDVAGSVNDPYLLVTYDTANVAPTAPTLTGPGTTNNSFGDSFEGDHHDPDGDPMAARHVQVYPASLPAASYDVQGTKTTWQLDPSLQTASSDETRTGHFSVPLAVAAGQLKLGTAYVWRARTQDPGGLWGAFSAVRGLTITSSAPTAVATALPPQPSMSGARFGGTYTDPEHNPLAFFQMQMQPVSAHSDVAFSDPSALVWDTGPTAATTTEIANALVTRSYAGTPLGAGNYTYRVRMQDSTGAWSAWSYADWVLSADFDPDPQSVSLTTQIARNPPTRIALFSMGPNRGPGNLIGYVDDPTDLGGSAFLNGAGELYFSLPALHPYCPSIEPHQTHYAVEQYYGDRYVQKFTGLITDFDAESDTVTFYGTDYLGLLMTAVDERYSTNAELAADGSGGGGSKYTNQTLDYIIRDQLAYHRKVTDSPVGFISIPASGASWSVLSERATIYSTYAEALPFISGLINSHKQGTGREVRFYARPSAAAAKTTLAAAAAAGAVNVKVASVASWAVGDAMSLGPNDVVKVTAVGTAGAGGTGITFTGQPLKWAYPVGAPVTEVLWEWALIDNWGKDRPNIVLEWGGLLNDFRVVALGDFGTRVLAVGQKRGEVKVYRAVGTGGLVESQWGRTAKTAFFPDIIDQNDLQRRANENASQLSKIGKRMALALQADALSPFDGWDIGDNVIVLIERGVVDTLGYGSGGFWTIYGVEWRYNPDGHSDLTPTVMPKKSATPPDPDLIPSVNPGVPLDWQVGHGVPISYGAPPDPTPPPTSLRVTRGGEEVATLSLPLDTDPILGAHYQDLNSGCIYELDQDWDSPTYGTYIQTYCPDTSGGGGTPYVPDTTPPAVPVIKGTPISQVAPQDDGTSYVGITSVVGYATPPVGLNDLAEYLLQSTRFEGATPGQPDWSRSTEWTTQVDDATGATDVEVVQPSVQAATPYWLRVAAIDKSGNRSGWSPIVSLITADDVDGPPPPGNITTVPGNASFGVRWDPVGASDLAYVEVEWKAAADTTWGPPVHVAGTLVVVTGVLNGTVYNVRVRSVDTSGNVQTGATNPDGSPISGDESDDTIGWVSAPNVTPSGVPGSSIVWSSADIDSLFAHGINADYIVSGTLRVGGAANHAAAIEVYHAPDAAHTTPYVIGRWSEAGIEILDSDPTTNYKMTLTESGLVIQDVTDPANPIPIVTISPLGIDAASITFGSARGGHNMVLNSSFEMGAFITSVNTPNVWDVTADFSATRQGADTNITITGGTVLGMTAI